MSRKIPVVAIVGTGIAGLRASKAIARSGVTADIHMIGEESYRTYNRPGLSKRSYSASVPGAEGIEQDLEIKDALDSSLSWHLGTRVERSDLRNKVLHFSSGEVFHYDNLVIATGSRARTSGSDTGRCSLYRHRTLRNMQDAKVLHRDLRAGTAVTIQGAGFVALEVASLAKAYGNEVVVLETPGRGPFEGLLGKSIAGALRNWFISSGINFRQGIHDCRQVDAHWSRQIGQGECREDQPLLVEAIGSVPSIEWLAGNGLDLSDGVRVSEYMCVPQYRDVFAAGDVARYPDPTYTEDLIRLEYWKNSIDTGDLAGRSVAASLGSPPAPFQIKYFPNTVTEVCGLRIQIAGNTRRPDSTAIISGDLNDLGHGVIVSFQRRKETVGLAYIGKGAELNGAYLRELGLLKGSRLKGYRGGPT